MRAAMDVLIFGATGMVGQGVLRECLLDPEVTRVVTVGRTRTGTNDAKLRELVTAELFDLTPLEPQLAGSTPASSASAPRPRG